MKVDRKSAQINLGARGNYVNNIGLRYNNHDHESKISFAAEDAELM